MILCQFLKLNFVKSNFNKSFSSCLICRFFKLISNFKCLKSITIWKQKNVQATMKIFRWRSSSSRTSAYEDYEDTQWSLFYALLTARDAKQPTSLQRWHQCNHQENHSIQDNEREKKMREIKKKEKKKVKNDTKTEKKL